MFLQTIKIDGKTYRFKIGLNEIIYLQSLSEIKEEDVFAAGLISLQPIQADELKHLYARARETGQLPSFSFLNADVMDLYSKAVGELGISPDIALLMEPDEIELAYIGYLRRQEMTANLNKLAMLQALNGDKEPIKIVDKLDYTFGSIEEREKTFTELEIE